MSTQIQEITNKVDRVEDILQNRLPEQRKTTLARVYGWKWLLSTLYKRDGKREIDANILKKVRIEVGQYWYRCAEQAEVLTMALCLLDNVESAGQSKVRAARKAQVLRIQSMLDFADSVKTQAELLKNTCEAYIVPLIEEYQSQPEDTTDSESDSSEPEKEESEQMEQEDKVETKEEEQMEEEECLENEAPEQMEEAEEEPRINSLPIYKPKYQATREQDGVYLRVNVAGVSPKDLEVSLSDNVVQVSGVKYPRSNRELYAYQMTGNPTFGRFIVTQKFSIPSLSFENATYELTRQNQVLQVFIPYKVNVPRRVVHQPPMYSNCYRRAPWQQAAQRRRQPSPFGLVW